MVGQFCKTYQGYHGNTIVLGSDDFKVQTDIRSPGHKYCTVLLCYGKCMPMCHFNQSNTCSSHATSLTNYIKKLAVGKCGSFCLIRQQAQLVCTSKQEPHKNYTSFRKVMSVCNTSPEGRYTQHNHLCHTKRDTCTEMHAPVTHIVQQHIHTSRKQHREELVTMRREFILLNLKLYNHLYY